MIDDLFEPIKFLIRILIYFIVDIIFEFVFKGPGYLLCRLFSRSTTMDSRRVLIVSTLFWCIVILVAIYIYQKNQGII